MRPTVRLEWVEDADRALPLPAYRTEGAAGADLCANLPPSLRAAGVTLQPGARALVPTGLRMQIPPGWEMQVRPRSGLALHHGIVLPNSPGTVDSDYRGPVGVILMNLGESPFTVNHGDRIAQAVVSPVAQATFAVDGGALDRTERGARGFGSTGLGGAERGSPGAGGGASAERPASAGAREGRTSGAAGGARSAVPQVAEREPPRPAAARDDGAKAAAMPQATRRAAPAPGRRA